MPLPVQRSHPSTAGEPALFCSLPPQVNRRNSCNHLCFSMLSQTSRYTCGSLAFANLPQNAFLPRCALLSLPQVNQAFLANLQSTSVFPRIVRCTCESSLSGNVPQMCLSSRFALLRPPQVNRHNLCNHLYSSILPQIARYTCRKFQAGSLLVMGSTCCTVPQRPLSGKFRAVWKEGAGRFVEVAEVNKEDE